MRAFAAIALILATTAEACVQNAAPDDAAVVAVADSDGLLCGPGQVRFEDRCAMQCAAQDNTLCELDGGRVGFAQPDAGTDAAAAGDFGACGAGPCPSSTPVELALGNRFTCARMDDNTVRCIGFDGNGQLGGSGVHAPIPGLLAAHLSAGSDHTCALLADHTVQCWGLNDSGQLGDGTTIDRDHPVPVVGVAGVLQLAAAGHVTYARLDDGRVVLWGSRNDRAASPYVADGGGIALDTGIDHATQISAANGGLCAVRDDGSIRCYGTGDGLNGNSSPTVSMQYNGATVTTARAVACTAASTCLAHLADDSVIGWGFERTGALGCCSRVAYGIAAPTRIAALSGIAVAESGGGLNFACTRRANGQILCAGEDTSNQLGVATVPDGGAINTGETNGTDLVQPVPLAGAADQLAVGTESLHACARLASDHLYYCWGNDMDGQLGTASLTHPLVFQ